LAPNSITSWEQLELKFCDHFFSGSYELKLSHLTSVKQMRDEFLMISLEDFAIQKTDALM